MADHTTAIRIVHLLGGCRAYDEGGANVEVSVGLEESRPILKFLRPAYGQLHGMLLGGSLQPVGTEFIYHASQLTGAMPIEWQTWSVDGHFKLMRCKQQWANVRHDSAGTGNAVVATVSGKIDTYLELLNIRLQQLSTAYNATLRAHLTNCDPHVPATPGLFSNMFMRDVDAAIHAFVADAASFRDALAEACWSLLLKHAGKPINTMAKLAREAKDVADPLVREVIQQTGAGGWIKNLTDLRNHIVHAAPVSRAHELSFCELRFSFVGGTALPTVHYPLTNADWSMRKGASPIADFSDEAAVRAAAESYRQFAHQSGDALEYCWRTTSQMVELAEKIRIASGLRADTPTVQPIGSIRTRRTKI